MTPISAVVITYNEEANIKRCILSLKPVVDEIIVLDSFSTDATESICKELGVMFYQHHFDGHIEQKNRVIAYTSYNLVLSLDADEALDQELQKAIIQVKQSPRYDGYYLNRLTNYCGTWIKHGNWYPDRKLRLWDKRKGKWGGLNPHDRFELTQEASVTKLNGHLLHYSFYTFDQHLAQIHKFTDISSKAAFERGKKSYTFKLIVNPLAKFIGGYFMKLGFLDGKAGFQIAWYSAYATFLKYSKLAKLTRNAR